MVVALAAAAVAAAGSARRGNDPATNLGTAGGLTYMSDVAHVLIRPGTTGGATPNCLAGTRAVGGGAVADGPASESALSSDGFGPRGRRFEWFGTAMNLDDSPKDLTGYVVCKAGPRRYVNGPSGVRLRTGEARSTRVSCPAGTRLIGGGGFRGGPGNRFSRTLSSYPFDDADGNTAPDDGWRMRAYKISGTAIYIQAVAVCINGGHLSYQTAPPGVGFMACPAAAHVTSGGVRLTGADASEAYLSSMRFDDGGDGDDIPDDLWLASFGDLGGGIQTVFAICLR